MPITLTKEEVQKILNERENKTEKVGEAEVQVNNSKLLIPIYRGPYEEGLPN